MAACTRMYLAPLDSGTDAGAGIWGLLFIDRLDRLPGSRRKSGGCLPICCSSLLRPARPAPPLSRPQPVAAPGLPAITRALRAADLERAWPLGFSRPALGAGRRAVIPSMACWKPTSVPASPRPRRPHQVHESREDAGCRGDEDAADTARPGSARSFAFSTSFTRAGLPLPCMAFITWPTKKPNSLSLPERYSATLSAFAASTASITRLDRAGIGHLAQAALLDDGAGRLAGLHHRLEHLLGELAAEACRRPSGRAARRDARPAPGGSAMRALGAVEGGEQVAGHPVGGELGVAALRHRLEDRRPSPSPASAHARRRATGPCADVARAPGIRQLRQRRLQLLHPGRPPAPAAAGRGRGSSGSRAHPPWSAWSA